MIMIKPDLNQNKEYHYVTDELDAEDSRRLLNIMTEFIDGFSLLSGLEPMVTVFGSAQNGPDDPFYRKAVELGAKLAGAGINVLTGGGPGIMEAANKGAREAGGKSIGIAIDLPQEQPTNLYMTHSIRLRHFFVRKVMLIKYSRAFILFPGGYGTLDELFESLNLIRTKRTSPFPVILFGREHWRDMVDWLHERAVRSGYLTADDIDIMRLTDDLDEVVRICRESINSVSDSA